MGKKLKRTCEQKMALQLRRVGLLLAPEINSDLLILQELCLGGARAATELAGEVQLTSGSMTAAINRLEKDGLVKRAATELDRRKVYVTLTKKGEQAAKERSAKQRKDLKVLFKGFTDREQALLRSLLKRVENTAG